MQIIILGMHRSGTSMITRLINMLGAYVGPESAMMEHHTKEFNHGNTKGHWERQDVMDMNDNILATANASWDMPATETPLGADIISDEHMEAIKLCVYGMDGHRPWVMKDPRLCLTLPYWLKHMEMPLVIVATRNPEEIALSLNKRDNMPQEKGMALWEYYMSSALNATLEVPRFFVDHADIIERPMSSLKRMHDWLIEQGCRRLSMPDERELKAFIDPDLYRARDISGRIGFTNMEQQRLWQILQGKLPQVGDMECSESSRALLSAAGE